MNEHETRYPEQMSDEARRVMVEISHALNMDTMKPSFGKIVTIQCLYAIQKVCYFFEYFLKMKFVNVLKF